MFYGFCLPVYLLMGTFGFLPFGDLKNTAVEDFLEVQWLRICSPVWGFGLYPWSGN